MMRRMRHGAIIIVRPCLIPWHATIQPFSSRAQSTAELAFHNVSDRNQRAWNGRSLTYRHAQHFQYQGQWQIA